MRAEHLAVIGQNRRGIGHLQRGVGVEALADTDTDHVGGQPFLIGSAGACEALEFPFLARQYPDGLSIQINAGLGAQTELADQRPDAIDAHVPGQFEKEGIAGDGDGFLHGDHAIAARVVVAEFGENCREDKYTRRRTDVAFLMMPDIKRRHGHERLEGRTGRVDAAQRAVDQWFFPVRVHRGPGLAIDAVDELIRVETGLGQKGQYAAVGADLLRLARHGGWRIICPRLPASECRAPA